MQTLALIPARKGSNRIPDKNIKEFAGIPIIGYSIKAALEWHFDEVIVYTDSYKYSKIAKEFGAKVPFRRDKVDDNQSLYDCVREVLTQYKLKQKEFDYVCLIYPCAPFFDGEIIEAGYNLMLWGGYDAVFPVAPNPFHYQQLFYFRGEKIQYVFPAFRDTPSNQWEGTYRFAGQYLWLSVPRLKYNKTLIPDNSSAIVVHPWEAVVIDTPEDWEYAVVKYIVLKEMGYR